MEQNETPEFENVEEVAKEKPARKQSATGIGFFDSNRRTILIGTGALVGVILLWFGYQKLYADPLNEEAEGIAFKAEEYFAMDSFNLAMKGDGRYKGLIDIVDEYGSTKAGKRASYMLGIIYLRQGKFDDAITQLENFDLGDKMIQTLATGAIGDCYVEKNELEKAVGYYEKAAENSKLSYPAARFYKKAGLVYENLKQYDRAVSAYETIQKEFPKSQEAGDIDKYIARAKTMLEK